MATLPLRPESQGVPPAGEFGDDRRVVRPVPAGRPRAPGLRAGRGGGPRRLRRRRRHGRPLGSARLRRPGRHPRPRRRGARRGAAGGRPDPPQPVRPGGRARRRQPGDPAFPRRHPTLRRPRHRQREPQPPPADREGAVGRAARADPGGAGHPRSRPPAGPDVPPRQALPQRGHRGGAGAGALGRQALLPHPLRGDPGGRRSAGAGAPDARPARPGGGAPDRPGGGRAGDDPAVSAGRHRGPDHRQRGPTVRQRRGALQQ